jgi:hypothetical protein
MLANFNNNGGASPHNKKEKKMNRANIIASIVSGDLLSDFDLLMEDEGFRSKFKKYVKDKSVSIDVATEDLVFYANENLC